MASISTRHLAEFLSGLSDIVETGTVTVVITTSGIASQSGSQTVTITASGAIGVSESASQTVTITTTGVERVDYFYDGTATISIFTEGRAKVHAFDTYKDGLQNLRIA